MVSENDNKLLSCLAEISSTVAVSEGVLAFAKEDLSANPCVHDSANASSSFHCGCFGVAFLFFSVIIIIID